MRRLVAPLLALALALAPLVGRAGEVRAQRPSPAHVAPGTVEPVLLEVRLGQAASLAVAGERRGERAWLPVASLFDAMELQVDARTATRVVATRWPARTVLVLDADSALARIGGRTVAIPADALVARDGELLADVRVVATLLGIPAELAFADMVLSFPEIAALPIGQRLAREAARARFRASADVAQAPADVAPLARPWADGAVLDYSLSMPIGGVAARPGFSTGLGLDVLGGSLEVTAGRTGAGATLPTLASWTGVWRTGTKLAQLRVGDGTGAGPRPRLGRGVMLTNAPYMRPALFGLQAVRGALPPGWAIEAYRNGQLVAVDTVGRDASYQLSVPLLYGENPYELIAVGPFGQTRAISQATRVAMDLLPAGRTEYAVGASQCQFRQQCRTAASADLRHGLGARWTVRGGLETLARDSVGWRAAPYVGLSGTPTSAIGVQGELAASSHARVAVNVEPSQRVRVVAEQQWFAADPIDPLLAGRRRAQSSAYATWRSFSLSQATVEASLDRSLFDDGRALVRARLAAGAQGEQLRWQGYLRLDQQGRGAPLVRLHGAEVTILPDARRGPVLGGALWRVIGEVDGAGRPWRTALTGAIPLPLGFRIDAGAAWQRGQRGLLATLMVARDLNTLRSYTTGTASAGSASLSQSVQGSMLLHRREGKPVLVPGPSLQRAGVAGIVWLDRDGDGVRDLGEPVLPGVRVQVGSGHATSDSLGRYRIWDLVPYVPLPVAVDSTTLPSPLWVPALAHREIEIGPNRFEPVDVPLVPGGVIEGRVRDAIGGGGDVPVEIVDARGAVVARATTFSDGEFIVMGVRPGRVTARIASGWLASLDATATPTTTDLATSDDGATARVADLVVVRQRMPVPDDAATTTGALVTVSSPSVERSSSDSVRTAAPSAAPTSATKSRTSRSAQGARSSRGRSAAARSALPSRTARRAAPQPPVRTRSVQPSPSRRAATSRSSRGAGSTRAETAIVPCCAPAARPGTASAPATTAPARGTRKATRTRRIMRGDIGSTGARHEETDAVRRRPASHGAGRDVVAAEPSVAQGDGCEWDGHGEGAPPRAYRVFVASLPRSATF